MSPVPPRTFIETEKLNIHTAERRRGKDVSGRTNLSTHGGATEALWRRMHRVLVRNRRRDDAGPTVRNLQRDGAGKPLRVDLRSDLVAGFQLARHSLDFRLSSHMQSHFPTRDLLHDEFLTFPIQYVTIDRRSCSRLRTLQGICVCDDCEGEKENKNKKNWHGEPSFYF